MPKVIKQEHGGELHVLQKGETANPNGRPKKVVAKVVADLLEEGYDNVSRSQIVDAFEILLNLDEERLKEIVKDSAQPMLFRITAKQLLSDKGFSILKDLLDRAHGRPNQAVDVTSGGEKMQPFKGFSFLEPLAKKVETSQEEKGDDEE